MAKRARQSEIQKVQERIKLGKIELDKGLHLIEELEAQIETMRQEQEARKQARREKRN